MKWTGKYPRVRLLAAGAVLVPAGLSSGAYLLADRSPSCGRGDLPVRVAAAPDIAPALGEIAARFDVQLHEVRGRCVRVRVQARDPALVARALESRAPVGADVWVPDSSIWPAQVTARGVAIGPEPTFVAVSPLVLAVPRPAVAALRRAGLYGTWHALDAQRTPRRRERTVRPGRTTPGAVRQRKGVPRIAVQALDPAANAAGAAATLAVRTALGRASANVRIARSPDTARLFAALARPPRGRVPVLIAAEQAVVAYNAAHPQDPAEIAMPGEGTLLLDHPIAVLTTDPLRAEAIDAFRWAITSQEAADVLQRHGFRTSDGRIDAGDARRLGLTPAAPALLPHPSPAQIAAALRG